MNNYSKALHTVDAVRCVALPRDTACGVNKPYGSLLRERKQFSLLTCDNIPDAG